MRWIRKIREFTLVITFVIFSQKWQIGFKMKVLKYLGIQPNYSHFVDHFDRKLTIFDLNKIILSWIYAMVTPKTMWKDLFLTTCAYFWISILIKHFRKFVNCRLGMFPSIFRPSVPRVLLLCSTPSSRFMTKYSRSWQPGWMLAAQNIWGCNRHEYGGLKN